MEPASKKILCASARPNVGLAIREMLGGTSCRRTMSTSPLRAAKATKSTKTPLKKAQRPHLEYKTPTRKPSPSQDCPKARPNPLNNRTIPIVFGSITLFGLSGYCTYLYITLTRPNPIPTPIFPAQQDVSSRYNTIASTFDASVSSTENLMGITSLRRKLISQAHGDVLEVSIGTGRNLDFYDWNFQGFGGVGKVDNRGYIKKGKIRSFTAVDKSAEMLEIAHEKFGAMFPGILGVRWVVGDAGEKGVIPGPPKGANERSGSLDRKYDTVVQTMGLCSVGNPVGLLRTLGECVKEEEGRILLLEHGRGKWDWLNGLLDKSAEGHAKEFGCWWNRDMATIVKESGLEVVKMETPKWWHCGTTWWIELKKPKSEIDGKTATKHASQVEEPKKEKETQKKGWWR